MMKLVGVGNNAGRFNHLSTLTDNRQIRKVSGKSTGMYTLATIMEISDRKNVLSKEVSIALRMYMEEEIVNSDIC